MTPEQTTSRKEFDTLRERLAAIWAAPIFNQSDWNQVCADMWRAIERAPANMEAALDRNLKHQH